MPRWHGAAPRPAPVVVPQGAVEQVLSAALRTHGEQVAFAHLMGQLRGH